MTKSLVIVESPAKAKTIERFLGRNYSVKASMGHVRDLPKSQLGVDVENEFEPKYITIRGKGPLIKELREAAKKNDRVLLAADPDREGEAISWHLAHILGLQPERPCRITFNEITKGAIREAMKHPRPIDRNLVDAQQARRILDRLVGYNLSPLLWRKVRRGLSAGRVQSLAVRLISDREEEISDFIPREYWSITVRLQAKDGATLEAKLWERGGKKAEIADEAAAEKLISGLRAASFVVADVRKREKKRSPAQPFTTSSLQQEAFRKLNFTTKKTMYVAQQLYEGLEVGAAGRVGLITYIRTDSHRVAEVAEAAAAKYIGNKYGADYCPTEKKTAPAGAAVQDAHEAIRPTYIEYEPAGLKEYLARDQYRLYRLIWERFIASQMSPAVYDTVTIDVRAGDCLFRASGSQIKFPGFTAVYVEESEEEEKDSEGLLPDLATGQSLTVSEFLPRQHYTQPPPRYTEAMLVRTMEENGVGRPSTYAPTIETIKQRGYVTLEEKRFYATELGQIVVDLLKDFFPEIIDVEFTAAMEKQLDRIEEGDLAWRHIISSFYQEFAAELAEADKNIVEIELKDEETDIPCDNCGRMMVVKYGRFGKFLACPGFPDCRNTKPYLEETGVDCPVCGGTIVARTSKKGRKFYGCANYPECDFVSWQKPVAKSCPECGAYLVEKRSRRRGTYYRCSRKECGYEEAAEDDAE
ncbi:MAG: type I DNA topoisomerase [bacterium]